MNARKTILKVCAWITARLDPPRRATNEEILDLAPDAYWREPSDSTDSVYFWKDFDESKGREVKRGMLSSDQIRQYATELRMIEPYNPVQIKPASYDLTLGPLYQIDGEDHVLSKEKPTLEIPPNSIVFVAMGERLMLPHYVIGRFDLQIEFIYQGLLLGTGPQF